MNFSNLWNFNFKNIMNWVLFHIFVVLLHRNQDSPAPNPREIDLEKTQFLLPKIILVLFLTFSDDRKGFLKMKVIGSNPRKFSIKLQFYILFFKRTLFFWRKNEPSLTSHNIQTHIIKKKNNTYKLNKNKENIG